MVNINDLPPQRISFKKKNKEWRRQHLDWADNRTHSDYNLLRKSFSHKKINYDLLNGKLNLKDLELILNPSGISADFIPDNIQHYPIINSKLNVLRGEEFNRGFDYRVVITNPNAISEKEKLKKQQFLQDLQVIIQNTSLSEEEFNERMEELMDYYTYEYQDFREMRANELLSHYSKEYSFPSLFNDGFMDAITVGEELYITDIVSGEPILKRINPLSIKLYQSGTSDRAEDADIAIIEEYWSLSKIVDTYYEDLTDQDFKNLENLQNNGYADEDNYYDERNSFILTDSSNSAFGEGILIDNYDGFANGSNISPYIDNVGNIRVLKVFWKSLRRVKKVTYFDPVTGEEMEDIFPEDYIIDKDAGETEKFLDIMEAWEGTKIGRDIYIKMRPRPIQYNRLSNPSRCHFGIVGTIYSLNNQKPFSLVDMMKPYNYLYDCIHDRLNKAIAASWGRLLEVDLASVPTGWTMDKWMYFAKTNKLLVKDSFKEGNVGAATGRLAGAFSSNTRGAVDVDNANYIQEYIQLLEYIKNEMSEAVGISKQREGQIHNRETVGGVERATLQSTHITEWLFMKHDDTKKRAIEMFLETAKINLKGKKQKFQNILSDYSIKLTEIDGDEFAEADYGLVVSGSSSTSELKQKLDQLAHAALQTQSLSFSTIMKIFTNSSLADTQRMIERNEREFLQRQQKQANDERNMQIQINNSKIQQEEAKLQQEDILNMRDNETKLIIAQLQNDNSKEIKQEDQRQRQNDLNQKVREFEEKMKLEKSKLELQKNNNKNKQQQ